MFSDEILNRPIGCVTHHLQLILAWQDELAWSWVLELGWLDSLLAAWEQTFISIQPQSLLPQLLLGDGSKPCTPGEHQNSW
jgi:hypothetical protein